MTNIEFNDNSQLNTIKQKVMVGQTESSGIIGFMIQKGVVKNTQTAQGILLVITILCLCLAVYIVLGTGAPKSEAVPAEIQGTMQPQV